MLETVKEIMEEKLNLDGADITSETRFKEDLDVDSLDLFEIIMALEEEFNIEIPADDLTDLATVGEVVAYIESKIA